MAESRTDRTAALPDWRGLAGYDDDLTRWRQLAQSGRLPPVILIHGRAGLAKRSIAAALVASLRCADPGAKPCGTCDSCRELRAGHDQDVLWLSGREGKLLVDAADAVQEHLSVAPAPGVPRRVVVITDCDQLAREAANRLLKTLEEPSAKALVVMTTSHVERLLPTVLSRCVKWRVKPPPATVTAQIVKARLVALGQAPSDAAVAALVERAGLSPGAALLFAEREADADYVAPDFMELLQAPDGAALLAAAERLAKQSGLTMAELLSGMEMALNAAYRQQSSLAVASLGIKRRRERLAEMKRLVLTGMVPVNAQMGMETIALTARPRA